MEAGRCNGRVDLEVRKCQKMKSPTAERGKMSPDSVHPDFPLGFLRVHTAAAVPADDSAKAHAHANSTSTRSTLNIFISDARHFPVVIYRKLQQHVRGSQQGANGSISCCRDLGTRRTTRRVPTGQRPALLLLCSSLDDFGVAAGVKPSHLHNIAARARCQFFFKNGTDLVPRPEKCRPN